MTCDGSEHSLSVPRRVAVELGLVSLYASPLDVKLLCLQRFVRLFAYGLSTLILVAYLEALGIRKPQIGLFMTLTLVGDICISFFLTLVADGLGRKAILAAGAVLMAISGVIFATTGIYWLLLLASIVGVISPSGSEIGPFRAIEESVVAHLTPLSDRGDVYAWYSLSGLIGAALGMVASGWVVKLLTLTFDWDIIRAYRAIYWGYAAFGVVKLVLALALTPAIEPERKQQRPVLEAVSAEETSPLLGSTVHNGATRRIRSCLLVPDISRESISIVVTLCLLFAMDALGSGVTPISWITYYFQTKFHVDEGTLGTIFCVTQVLAGLSMLVASSLAKRFGNIPTMVFTHLPSSVFRALIGVADNYYGSLALILLNAATQSMDTAPRTAFLAMMIPAEERTAVMGTVNVVKTASQSVGPLLTGFLAQRNLFWVSFLVSGVLKGSYDIGLLALFKNKEREQAQKASVDDDNVADEPAEGSQRRSEEDSDDERRSVG